MSKIYKYLYNNPLMNRVLMLNDFLFMQSREFLSFGAHLRRNCSLISFNRETNSNELNNSLFKLFNSLAWECTENIKKIKKKYISLIDL